MTPKYLKAQKMIEAAIRDRIISLSNKQATKYEQGTYRPQFLLAAREGKLICIACVNKEKYDDKHPEKPYDIEVIRLSFTDVHNGLSCEDKLGKGKSWPEVIRCVMRHFRMRPGD